MNKEKNNKLIVINTSANIIQLYEKETLVKELFGIDIGKNGLTSNKKEGDMCTPIGQFNLGFAFGTIKNDTFSYPYYKINENMYWVSDQESPYYNKLVEISDQFKKEPYPYYCYTNEKNWQDAEHLIDYPIEYELAIVIEYNMKPCTPGNGSAIFFHLQNKETTSGCISTTKENLLYILNWLDNDNGQIKII